jgi:hypothetical protein
MTRREADNFYKAVASALDSQGLRGGELRVESDPDYAEQSRLTWHPLAEMAQSLGYGKQIKYAEIDRAYTPMLFVNNALMIQNTSKEWLRILEHSENLGTPRAQNPEE